MVADHQSSLSTDMSCVGGLVEPTWLIPMCIQYLLSIKALGNHNPHDPLCTQHLRVRSSNLRLRSNGFMIIYSALLAGELGKVTGWALHQVSDDLWAHHSDVKYQLCPHRDFHCSQRQLLSLGRCEAGECTLYTHNT